MESSSSLKNSDDISVSETNQYKEIQLSNLEQKKNWHPAQNLHLFKGFWFYPTELEGLISSQEQFKPQPNDIILCNYPKSGMTWLKSLCYAIMKRTQFTDSTANRLLTELPHNIVPFLETPVHNDLPLWATHIPFTLLPNSIVKSNCKFIYICRNPKDVLISLWHFIATIGGSETIPLEEAFQNFCDGVSAFGPHWDHVLSYWEASLKYPERVMVIKYEDLQADTCELVKRVAEFMGCGFSVEEERSGLVERVVELCSFKSLSNLEVNKSKKCFDIWPIKFENRAFFRKGEVGDWENYLTGEMATKLDEIAGMKFGGSGLSFTC
ncbi:cytosolic sulfotransferase 18-like [Mercurialis annua]|uniref:cytosolic sulfotransferase 18-like n=1 Tax=Mercurialis annua TaxID=3986 RepID=UPI002160490E|nr:cytosolic sulfotransferase 18-like [Mercurialis annua]